MDFYKVVIVLLSLVVLVAVGRPDDDGEHKKFRIHVPYKIHTVHHHHVKTVPVFHHYKHVDHHHNYHHFHDHHHDHDYHDHHYDHDDEDYHY